MWNAVLIIFGLKDDPVTGAVDNAREIIQHSMKRAIIADRAAVHNAAATKLLNDVLTAR